MNASLTEYNEQKIREKDRRETFRDGILVTSWLWEIGRGKEAKMIANDPDALDRLYDEYLAAQEAGGWAEK